MQNVNHVYRTYTLWRMSVYVVYVPSRIFAKLFAKLFAIDGFSYARVCMCIIFIFVYE